MDSVYKLNTYFSALLIALGLGTMLLGFSSVSAETEWVEDFEQAKKLAQKQKKSQPAVCDKQLPAAWWNPRQRCLISMSHLKLTWGQSWIYANR